MLCVACVDYASVGGATVLCRLLFTIYNKKTARVSLLSGNITRVVFLAGKVIVPSESDPQELSNEWSCQYVSTILNLLGNFCVPHLATEVTISPKS
jgi:hypothetical protein